MGDPKILTHHIKFCHPFPTIVNGHILWNPKFAYYFFLKKFSNSCNNVFFYRFCFTPFAIGVNDN